jgi:hypothetical protein
VAELQSPFPEQSMLYPGQPLIWHQSPRYPLNVNMTVNTEQLSMAHANVTIVIMIIPAHYHAPALGTVLMGHVIVDFITDFATRFSHPPCLTTSTSRSSQGNITIASEVTII